LWADELWRANVVLNKNYWLNYFFRPDDQTAITSPLYALLIRIGATFWISPSTLRISSLIPGILAPAIAFALVLKFNPRCGFALAALAALVFALNASFVSYSTTLKPYVFEVCVHLLCLYVWISAIGGKPTSKTWILVASTLVSAVLAAPNVVFLMPPFAITLLLKAYLERQIRTFWLGVAVFGGLLAFVSLMYLVAWRAGNNNGMMTYWAQGFSARNQNYIGFYLRQLWDMWRASFELVTQFPMMAGIPGLILLGSVAWLVVTKVRSARMRYLFLFYGIFLVTIVLLNYLRFWPIGALRANLFIYAHLIVLMFLLASEIAEIRSLATAGLLIAIALALWQVHGDRRYYSQIVARLHELGPPLEQNRIVVEDFSYGGRIGQQIVAGCPQHKTVLVEDEFIALAIEYFTKYDSAHHESAKLLTGNCVDLVNFNYATDDPIGTTEIFAQSIKSKSAWVLYSHLRQPDINFLESVARKFGAISERTAYAGAGYFLLTR
jgi:hypothetical protein